MTSATLLHEATQLSISERIELAEAIWDTVAANPGQRTEEVDRPHAVATIEAARRVDCTVVALGLSPIRGVPLPSPSFQRTR